MKDNKFRVFDATTDKYTEEDVYIGKNGVPHVRANIKGKNVLAFKLGLIVEEYTGFKDVNNVEIYEGDKVSFINPVGDKREGIIVYREDVASFTIEIVLKAIIPLELSIYFTDNITDIEKIGNIHDNSNPHDIGDI